MQALIREVIDTTDGTNLFVDRPLGLSKQYDRAGDTHLLVGRSAPDFEMLDGSRLGPLFEGGHGLLLDLESNAELRNLVSDCKPRVDYLAVDVKDRRGIKSLMIRPIWHCRLCGRGW